MTLGVLLLLCTPLAWMLARDRLPFPRIWEAGILCSLLLPPLVIGLLLVFMVGPYTWVGTVLDWVHQSATNTFLALVIAEVYESAPYYVLGARAAFAERRHRARAAGRAARRPAVAGCSAASRCRWPRRAWRWRWRSPGRARSARSGPS